MPPPAGPHRHIHGANLSFAAAAYLAAGGFSTAPFDEDVALLRAFLDNGERIAWARDLAVTTSARHIARAPHGFSSYLRTLHHPRGSDGMHPTGPRERQT